MIQGHTGGIAREGGWTMRGACHPKAALWITAQPAGKPAGPLFSTTAGLPFAKSALDAFSNGKNFSHGHPGWAWVYSQQQREAGAESVMLPVLADYGLKESVEGKVMFNGEPYRTRAFLLNAANPVRHYYPDERWKEMFSNDNVELVIAIDVLPSDTSAWADVILPNSTYLERSEPTLYGNGVNHDLAITTRYAAVDLLYDTQEVPDILYKMAGIISGDQKGFVKMIDDMMGLPADQVMREMDKLVKQGERSPYTAACRKVDFDRTAKAIGTTADEIDRTLRAQGVYFQERREEVLKKWAMPHVLPLATFSGRLEYYSGLFDMLRGAGAKGPHFSVLATHIPAQCRANADMSKPLDTDEFYFTYGKTPTVSYASTNSNNPVLAAINRFKNDIYTGVWIHPDRAERLVIEMGDQIKLTNTKSGQHATGRAYITRLIHRDVLFIHSSFGAENKRLTRSHDIGTATSKLVPYQVEPVVAGFRSQEFTLRVAKLNSNGGTA